MMLTTILGPESMANSTNSDLRRLSLHPRVVETYSHQRNFYLRGDYLSCIVKEKLLLILVR